jgi:hypothetical protein
MNDNDLVVITAGPHAPIPDIDDSVFLINSSLDFRDCDLSIPGSNEESSLINKDMVLLAPGAPSPSR